VAPVSLSVHLSSMRPCCVRAIALGVLCVTCAGISEFRDQVLPPAPRADIAYFVNRSLPGELFWPPALVHDGSSSAVPTTSHYIPASAFASRTT
jgi:hypothetical protein